MYEQHLKQVHLSRLSPVMWAYNRGYPRKTLGVPIKPAYGMGGCGCGSVDEENGTGSRSFLGLGLLVALAVFAYYTMER